MAQKQLMNTEEHIKMLEKREISLMRKLSLNKRVTSNEEIVKAKADFVAL